MPQYKFMIRAQPQLTTGSAETVEQTETQIWQHKEARKRREYEPGNNLEKSYVKHQWVITSITPSKPESAQGVQKNRKMQDLRWWIGNLTFTIWSSVN